MIYYLGCFVVQFIFDKIKNKIITHIYTQNRVKLITWHGYKQTPIQDFLDWIFV